MHVPMGPQASDCSVRPSSSFSMPVCRLWYEWYGYVMFMVVIHKKYFNRVNRARQLGQIQIQKG